MVRREKNEWDPETLKLYQAYLDRIVVFKRILMTSPKQIKLFNQEREKAHSLVLSKLGCHHPERSFTCAGDGKHRPCLKYVLAEQVEEDLADLNEMDFKNC